MAKSSEFYFWPKAPICCPTFGNRRNLASLASAVHREGQLSEPRSPMPRLASKALVPMKLDLDQRCPANT
jgi:hypothetical protein